MAGKIFYRERRQGEEGFEQPRYQVAAVAGVDLEIFGKHLRLNELRCIAEAVGAELVLLPGTSPRDEEERVEVG